MQEDASASRVQAWFARRSLWQRRGLAFLAGAVATLGHAPFQLTPLYAVALVVLVWLLDVAAKQQKRGWAAFNAAWFFALGHFMTGLYWIMSAFEVDSAAWGLAWAIPSLIGLAGGLALFWGAGAALMMPFWTRDMRRLPVFAVCLFVAEYARGHVLTGFPWLLGGYVWTPGEPVSQMASVVGAYGLTLLTLLFGAAPAMIADGQSSAGRRFAPTVIAGLLIGMIWGWGAQRIATAQVDPPGAQPIVRVTDSGLSLAEKWCEYPDVRQRYACAQDQEERVLQRYLQVSGTEEESHASVVIWPEGAIPTLNYFQLDNQAFLNELARGLGDRALIAGMTRCGPDPVACQAYLEGRRSSEGLNFYNSAAVIDGVSGVPRLSQTYDKHHLVPFGEYIPFWNLVSKLNIAPLQRIGAGFTPGEMPTRLIVPEAPPAVVLICYEAIFPGMVPVGAERPGWIVSVTNDSWFGDGSGPYQHYAMARYRAIEEGLPLARAASGGISAIVDAYGREVRATHRRGGFAEAQLPPSVTSTLFSSPAIGGKFLPLFLLAFIAVLRFLPPKSWAKGLKS